MKTLIVALVLILAASAARAEDAKDTRTLRSAVSVLHRQEQDTWKRLKASEYTLEKTECATKAQRKELEVLRRQWVDTHSALSSLKRLLGQD